MHSLHRLTIALLLSSICLGCTTAGPLAGEAPPSDTTVHILFVGNSLTFVNDLPALVRQQAKEKGIDVQTRMIARPNYALIDHLADGLIQQVMSENHFDYVVVQQGPSSQAEGRELLFEASKELAALCQTHQARLAFLMVWPSRTYHQTFEGVIENYTEAARRSQAILCPVGKVWKNHIDTTGFWDYYGPDGFHPSLQGSRVAAEVIVDSLFGL